MFVELFGPLVGLAEEWRAQGASEDEISLKAFDFDYTPIIECGGVCGAFGLEDERIVEDNDEFIITRDGLGRQLKLAKGKATIPLPINYPVTDFDSWLKVKPFYTFDEKRICNKSIEKAIHMQKQGVLVVASIPGVFWTLRDLMGDEAVCLAFYDCPELLDDILHTFTDTAIRVLEVVSGRVSIDLLRTAEDLAGKSGPLVGPSQVHRFFAPYYKKVWDLMYSQGTRLFSQDSDGNIEAVMEEFIGCGVNIFYPCEPAAGMDVVSLREKYGTRAAFKGGINKLALLGTKDEIERELAYKLLSPLRKGGMIFGLDHTIPNGVSIENYRFYIKTAREMLELPPIGDDPAPHYRMCY